MKVLFMDFRDDEGCALDIALRTQEAGHDTRYWLAKQHPVGDGLVSKPKDWQPSMDWAELIILTGNCDYPPELDEYFAKAYPIFGTNPAAAELELDREKGQEILARYGVKTLPYKVVSSPEEGIEHLVKTGRPFAMKPWGGEADKAMTCIPKDVNEGIFTLQKWKKEGLFKGQLMMQRIVKGVEIGISGFFGPGGWSSVLEESFEHKKFLAGDLGGNTGEMGTVIRHVSESKLFDMILEPLTDYLHLCKFVGDCNVNCIIDADGQPWPLEFTLRLGWPDFCIRQEVIKGDPIEWMADLLYGRDSLVVGTEIVVGVVMAHGDFPWEKDPPSRWAGYPIAGVTSENSPHLHWQQVMNGKASRLVDGKLRELPMMLTAGTYIVVGAGTGGTVSEAITAAYGAISGLSWGSNTIYRVDIGERLKNDLPTIQRHKFAKDMRY